jgi:lysine 2,3-aminomutase
MATSEAITLFLDSIKETDFNRGGANGAGVPGLKPFLEGTVPEAYRSFYSSEELTALSALRGTPRDIEDRMKVKLTDHYLELAQRSPSLCNLVKARPEETEDLAGEMDPSNQNKYSPIPGLLHKYEMILLYTAATCSAHCRYCYRLDLFSKKTGKEMANIDRVAEYIVSHNEKVRTHKGKDPETGQAIYPINEALLSGGDPMVLSNKRLARLLTGLAQAGVRTVRIGSKELAFYPYRFDANFFEMLDGVHALFPDVRFLLITHFTHPDEFLQKDSAGNYIEEGRGYRWLDVTQNAVEQLINRRRFISLENQTPIIYKVNDDAKVLRILQREIYRHGIGNHYLFQCREIEGHRTFAVPVETSWKIYTESQKGLSGVEKHARFVMSTEIGKMEVVGVTNGLTIFKIFRAPGDASSQGNIIIARSNPDALWISGYQDRIVSDDTGMLAKAENLDVLVKA